nr:hypothetical protein CFP56_21639 [Quercus suber]
MAPQQAYKDRRLGYPDLDANKPPIPTTEALIRHLGRLPQELADLIFEFTFLPRSAVRTITRKRYRPPTELQISAATRQLFAASFYGPTTTFWFVGNQDIIATADAWLTALPAAHRNCIQHIQFSFFLNPSAHLARLLRPLFWYFKVRPELGKCIVRRYLEHRLRLRFGVVTVKEFEVPAELLRF